MDGPERSLIEVGRAALLLQPCLKAKDICQDFIVGLVAACDRGMWINPLV